MKALLIQARDPDDVMADHEYRCFVERSGLSESQLLRMNSLEHSKFPITEVDAVFVGGSGAYSATSSFDWMKGVIDAIHEASDRKKPLFGSCWGFHMIAKAYGGEVITDEPNKELGTLEIRLTDEGRKDELFSTMPQTFMAQLGHKDNVPELPSNLVKLATSSRYIQALRVANAPVYATQFHPELTSADMEMRLRHYLDLGYVTPEEKAMIEDVLKSFKDSPEAGTLLKKFIEKFCR